MPKRVLKLITMPFAQWNKLHYAIVFLPIPVILIALIAASIML